MRPPLVASLAANTDEGIVKRQLDKAKLERNGRFKALVIALIWKTSERSNELEQSVASCTECLRTLEMNATIG